MALVKNETSFDHYSYYQRPRDLQKLQNSFQTYQLPNMQASIPRCAKRGFG